MTRIDSHQHFWLRARGDYAWLRDDVPALAPLLRDFLPEHLEPSLAAAGVSRTVVIQAAESTAETEYLLELADRHAFIGGVVGWVDLSRSDASRTLEKWAAHPKFKGVRPMLQDLPEVDWLAHAPHPELVRALVRLGLRLDALVRPEHLPTLLGFVRAWPELPVVIDHAAKPQLEAGWHANWASTWRRNMAELASLPRVMCKFSGLVTEMPAASRRTVATTAAALRPVWDLLMERFGPTRVMWGSDWPVLTLSGDYAGWLQASELLIAELPTVDQAQLWHGTARRFYEIT